MMKTNPFKLRDFRGVDLDHVARLEEAGIRRAAQMLEVIVKE